MKHIGLGHWAVFAPIQIRGVAPALVMESLRMSAMVEKARSGRKFVPASGTRVRRDHTLTHKEEIELATRIANGDNGDRNRLVQANLALVVRIARDFQGRGLDLEDLVGEGNLGLVRAAQQFDPRFGARFGTYAVYWIKEAIRRALVNTGATIRVPAHMVDLLGKCWRRASARAPDR